MRGNGFDVTVERLREFINDRSLRAGDKFAGECKLGVHLSRPIVREELSKVESQEFLTMIQGKNVYSRNPAFRTVIESLLKDRAITLGSLMQVRYILEPEIAKIACLNIKENQINKLEQIYHDMIKYLGFTERYIHADKKFHSCLAEATGNPALVIMVLPLINLVSEFAPLFYERPRTQQRVFALAHEELLKTLKRRDPEGAQKAMQLHLSEVTKWLENFSNKQILKDNSLFD